MSRAGHHYAAMRLTITYGRSAQPGSAGLTWRLMAKAPEEEWTEGSTVGLGAHRIVGQYPPSREDLQAAAIELLMAMEWTESGVVIH